ncbi:hypothetical protein H0H93_011187 [Arthromyces matolae]|nr:hypothetical protein H0H93_011187 [Arthromyces matolae]
MSPPTWATAAQKVMLKSHMPTYVKIQLEKKKTRSTKQLNRFFKNFNLEFFVSWPETNTLVEAGKLPASCLTDPQDLWSNENKNILKKAVKCRQKKIKTWYRNHSKKSLSSKKKTNVLLASLVSPPKRRRLHKAEEMYQIKYGEKIRNILQDRLLELDAEVPLMSGNEEDPDLDESLQVYADAEKEEHPASVQQSTATRSAKLKLRRKVVAEAWKDETPEVKQVVLEALEKEKADMLSLLDASKEGLERTPEQRELVIANILSLLENTCYEIWRLTGWSTTMITGGPNPALNNAISIQTIHYGETAESKNSFLAAYPQFHQAVNESFVSWLYDVYPHAKARKTSLNFDGASGPSDNGLYHFETDKDKDGKDNSNADNSNNLNDNADDSDKDDHLDDNVNNMDSDKNHGNDNSSNYVPRSPPQPIDPALIDPALRDDLSTPSVGPATSVPPVLQPDVPTDALGQYHLGFRFNTAATTTTSTSSPPPNANTSTSTAMATAAATSSSTSSSPPDANTSMVTTAKVTSSPTLCDKTSPTTTDTAILSPTSSTTSKAATTANTTSTTTTATATTTLSPINGTATSSSTSSPTSNATTNATSSTLSPTNANTSTTMTATATTTATTTASPTSSSTSNANDTTPTSQFPVTRPPLKPLNTGSDNSHGGATNRRPQPRKRVKSVETSPGEGANSQSTERDGQGLGEVQTVSRNGGRRTKAVVQPVVQPQLASTSDDGVVTRAKKRAIDELNTRGGKRRRKN